MARSRRKGSDLKTSPPEEAAGYTVMARRYRPQRFEDVVGQDHVVQALRNAIRMNRVTHAYVFSGTRGVGKTSVARIFAKCLNCERGTTEEPCQVCDICQAISVGQDIDVIEIDGASNNGVDAVRELRQNASLRPSRARFKIYYIDEVHMLSTGAFAALLKTLEEPPEHVKFFFATTEANKIPITILSRCQRYDFAGIAPEQIVSSLAEICTREQVEADADALRVVARRASGSMRDAQSLMEQLLASGGRRLTADWVHQALGLAPDERILDVIDALAERNGAAVLKLLDQAFAAGVQPADLLSGLLEFLRDVLVLAAGAEVALLATPPALEPRLKSTVERWPLDTILAAQQILAEARNRLRGSPHGRLVVELALMRVVRLENLTELGNLISRLSALESPSPPAAAPQKKIQAPREDSPESPPPPPRQDAALNSLTLDSVLQRWPAILSKLGVRLGTPLSLVPPVAISGPNVLVIGVKSEYNWVVEKCGSPEAISKIESALHGVLGVPATVRFELAVEATELVPAPTSAPETDELAGDPLVQKVVELFEARRILVDTEADRSS